MMNTVVAFRFFRAGLMVAVSSLLILPAGRVHAQRQGSRPIEFSEPRDKSARTTNDQQFGSERRRLTELEERLSKTFNFFDSDDSMSGAPAPRLPHRAPVPVKQSKPSGLFEEEDDWSTTDPLARLRELLDSESFTESRLEHERQQESGRDEVNLLNSLKTDDWLVRGTMSDTFWEIPLVAKREPREASQGNTLRSGDLGTLDLPFGNNLRPGVEDLRAGNDFGQPTFGSQLGRDRTFAGGNAFELGRPARSSVDVRRDEYRALLGLEPKRDRRQPMNTVRMGNPGPLPEAVPKFTPGVGDMRTDPQGSLYPVRSVDRGSVYPTAPLAPQRPSVFDPIEVESPVSTAPASASVLGSPFYEPPRRQF